MFEFGPNPLMRVITLFHDLADYKGNMSKLILIQIFTIRAKNGELK
jgi:hypothetical protein